MSAPPPNNPFSATVDASAGMEAVQQPQHPASPADGNGPYLPYRPNAALPPNRVSSGQTAAYSEIDSNPLPQIVFGNELPEVVKPTPAVAPDAVREYFFHGPIPVTAEDTQNIRGGAESEKQDTGGAVPWYRRKSMTICGVVSIVAVVVILAAVFGALGGLGILSKHRNTAASTEPQSTTSTPTQTTSSSASSSSTSSTTKTSSPFTSTPTPTILPECKLYSQYIHNISMVHGNVPVHGVGYKLPRADTQEDCCGLCYAEPQGCQIWVWDPITHPGPGQCTTVLGWQGDPVDDKCPWGHANSSTFTIQQKGTGIMYNGPCGHGGMIIGT
ncbi:hypothetical protein GE09DRAFT_1288826 [Coniochaeta sp. 2T2.1]|nr:hypothetical protein GE09DRAFT_1288826 [Coniochaeta sp. 2T2.1]